MSTEYLTAAGLSDIIGADALALAAPSANAANGLDAERIQAGLDAVAGEIDATLRSRYALPLVAIPDFLRRAAARMTHAALIDESVINELIESRNAEARATVRRVGNGQLQLDIDDGDGEGANRTSVGRATLVLPGGPRQFRRDQTRGIV